MTEFPAFTQSDPVFEKIDLTLEEQTFIRGKPLNYLKYTIEIFKKYTDAKVIVEVGSVRTRMAHQLNEFNPYCCNDGHSTYFWSAGTNASIYSVDIDPFCKAIIEADVRLKGVKAHSGDAKIFLSTFQRKIDLLFLDAWDVIPGTLFAQEHVDAYNIAKPKLSPRCLILIDDTDIGGGGKGKLLIPQLLQEGFKCLFTGRQTLFIRI